MNIKVQLSTCAFVILACFCYSSPQRSAQLESRSLAATSLCTNEEKIVFSCALKRSMKIVSLCSSQKLNKDGGYLQYRFGAPDKIELEFPDNRADSLKVFKYSHYFRAMVDYTEISFSRNGYTYTVFDEYNGEEKPPVSEQGLTVTTDGSKREVKYLCFKKPKADYGDLPEVFENSAP
jgi:hypothetical protein